MASSMSGMPGPKSHASQLCARIHSQDNLSPARVYDQVHLSLISGHGCPAHKIGRNAQLSQDLLDSTSNLTRRGKVVPGHSEVHFQGMLIPRGQQPVASVREKR